MPFMLVTESLEKEKDKFLSEIKKNSSYSFPPSSEYPLSELHEKKGIMFSLLIGESRSGEEVVLKGSSGMRIIPGYVNPCYSRNKMSEALEKHDKLLKSANGDEEKKKREAEALSEINSLFSFSSLSGDAFTLSSIESAKGGSGTCAGVKVLNSAIRKGYRIKAFAEFFVGKENENYKEGKFHPPCNERCKEIIGKMLLLDYVYVDEYIAVVEKPAGLLSVPGRGEDKRMRYLLLVSHGTFAPGLHSVLDMLVGKRDDILSCSLRDGEGADEYVAELEKVVAPIGEGDEVIVMGDIIGGRPRSSRPHVRLWRREPADGAHGGLRPSDGRPHGPVLLGALRGAGGYARGRA